MSSALSGNPVCTCHPDSHSLCRRCRDRLNPHPEGECECQPDGPMCGYCEEMHRWAHYELYPEELRQEEEERENHSLHLDERDAFEEDDLDDEIGQHPERWKGDDLGRMVEAER